MQVFLSPDAFWDKISGDALRSWNINLLVVRLAGLLVL